MVLVQTLSSVHQTCVASVDKNAWILRSFTSSVNIKSEELSILGHAHLWFAECKQQFLRAQAFFGADHQHEVVLTATEGENSCVGVAG